MKKKSVGLGILLFILLLMQMILFSPEELELRNPNEFLKVEEWDESIQQNMQGIKLVESEKSEKIWEMQAEQALAMAEANSWKMQNVDAQFFTNSNLNYSIKSEESFYDTAKKNIIFSKKVTVESSEGHIFETVKLVYDSKSKSLVGDSPVEFRSRAGNGVKAMKLKSSEIAINLNSGLAQLIGDVKSNEFEESGQKISFSSSSVLFDEASSKAILDKDVLIQYEDMLIKGPEAVLYFGQQKSELNKLVMEKGASLDSKTKKAVAGRLIIDIAAESIILESEPRLLQGGDELLGTQFVFKNKGKNLEVKGARAHLRNNNSGTVLDD